MRYILQVLWFQIKILCRDKALLVGSIGIATISLLVLGFMFPATVDQTLQLGIVDMDDSPTSRLLTECWQRVDQVDVTILDDAGEALISKRVHAVLEIPTGFGESLIEGVSTVSVFYLRSDAISESLSKSLVWGLTTQFIEALSGRQPVSSITLEPIGSAGTSMPYTDFLVPGLVGMMAFWTCLGTGPAILAWRQRGILDQVGLSGLSPVAFLLTQMIARLALSVSQTAIMLAVAKVVFGFGDSIKWIALPGVLLLVNSTYLAFGMAIASVVPRTESAWNLSVLITTPMVYLGGTYFRTDGLPVGLSLVAWLNPVTHANALLRSAMVGATWPLSSGLVILLLWLAGSLSLSAFVFKWSSHD